MMKSDLQAQAAKEQLGMKMGQDPNAPGEEAEEEVEDDKEEKAEAPEKKEFALKLDSLPGNYKAKVDFKLADQQLKTAVAKIKAEAQPIIEDIFEDLYDQLQKKNIIGTQNMEKADTIQLKYLKRFQLVFKKHFRRLYEDSKAQAQTEVKKSDFAANNLPNDEFLAFLEQETYKYIGDWEYSVTSTTKKELINAIKDGRPLSSVISILDDEGMKLSDVSLERYARTKTTEVFNRGRRDYFDSTGVVEAYQYSAILDDVTSEICGSLNGLTFPKDTCPTPPLHFNCRSLLIPITRFEEWSEDRVTNGGQNVDKFLEKNVEDKGFAIYSADAEEVKEEKPLPQITDPGIEIDTVVDGLTDRITYSSNGKAFQETFVTYDETRTKVMSTKHRRLDGEKV
jgi:SPP1 gp7 family putative phage head morphogenesis protein